MLKLILLLAIFALAGNSTLVNLPADSWYQVPNSRMNTVCMPGLSSFSCWAIAGAWGGAAYDTDDRLMLIWGGGHGDSYDNSVYAFSLDSLKWHRHTDNTGVYVNGDPQSNGDPSSRHTYDGLAYITHAKRFFGYNGATAVSGGASTVVWTFDVAAKKWYNMNAAGPKPGQGFGGNSGCAYDPVTQNVYYGDVNGIYAYNFGSNGWTKVRDWVGGQDYAKKRGILDTKRRILFFIGTGGFHAYDLGSGTDISTSWATTGGAPVFSSGQAAADYDSKADQIVGWGGSGGVYALNMTTKQWTQRSGTGAPTSAAGNGTYGRFRYIAEDNVFVLCNANPEYANGYQNVWFYKNTTGTAVESPAPLRMNRAAIAAPNPFQSSTTLRFSGVAPQKVSVFNLRGRRVADLAVDNGKAVFGGSFAPGVYTVVYRNGNQMKGLKIILEKK